MRQAISLLVLIALSAPALARDVDGHYAQQNPARHEWFESLHSKAGTWCCIEADGTVDPTWRREGDHFEVMVNGKWLAVDPSAVVTVPNIIGKPVVWVVGSYIRCFMPGEMG